MFRQGRTSHLQYRIPQAIDVDPDTSEQFLDNTYKERHIGVMGKDKFGLHRHTTASHMSNEISELS